MATQKQIEANRANAQKSTGAKTEAGKKTSSMNAMKHGLLNSRTNCSSYSETETNCKS